MFRVVGTHDTTTFVDHNFYDQRPSIVPRRVSPKIDRRAAYKCRCRHIMTDPHRLRRYAVVTDLTPWLPRRGHRRRCLEDHDWPSLLRWSGLTCGALARAHHKSDGDKRRAAQNQCVCTDVPISLKLFYATVPWAAAREGVSPFGFEIFGWILLVLNSGAELCRIE